MATTKKIRFGIYHRILATMIVVSIVPLATIWFLDYRATEKQLISQTNERLGLISDRLVGFVDGWVEMHHRMLMQNAKIADIRSMEAERQNPILRTITGEYPWVYLAFTTDTHGMNIGRSDDKPQVDYSDRSYVMQVLGGGDLGREVLIGKTSKKPALVLASPIAVANQPIGGVLAIAMSIEDVSDQIANRHIGETGRAFLLDHEGKVIAHPSNDYTSERKDLSSHPAFLAAKSNRSETAYESDGKDMIAWVQSTPQGWILVVEQERTEVFRALNDARMTAFIVLIVTMMLVVMAAMLLAHNLAAPIIRLTKVADDISTGQLHISVEECNRNDEIGSLAEAIERLRDAIALAMDRLQRTRS